MSREQTCKKFRTYWRKSQEVSEQIRLTVTHFLILNWQKKVKRQGWNFIFQKKKKGLKSSELFAFCLVVVSSFFYICPLQAQSCNRKRQINELFFSSEGKTTLLFVAFRLLVSIVQKKKEDPFPNDWKGLLWLTWRMFSLSKDNANFEDIFADKY